MYTNDLEQDNQLLLSANESYQAQLTFYQAELAKLKAENTQLANRLREIDNQGIDEWRERCQALQAVYTGLTLEQSRELAVTRWEHSMAEHSSNVCNDYVYELHTELATLRHRVTVYREAARMWRGQWLEYAWANHTRGLSSGDWTSEFAANEYAIEVRRYDQTNRLREIDNQGIDEWVDQCKHWQNMAMAEAIGCAEEICDLRHRVTVYREAARMWRSYVMAHGVSYPAPTADEVDWCIPEYLEARACHDQT